MSQHLPVPILKWIAIANALATTPLQDGHSLKSTECFVLSITIRATFDLRHYNMTDFTQKTIDNNIILFDTAVFSDPTASMFKADYWQSKKSLTGSSSGRGTTYFFKYQSKEYVLRHYLRGGLMGKVLDDQYLFAGMNQTRPWRELHLLAQMHELALPVPYPVAAKVSRGFAYYRADLIIERIEQARDVHQLLLKKPLEERVWRNIGACIAQFHQQQVFHHDLNIRNIMLDAKQKVWLIDFDKCEFKTGNSWKKANLLRLERSLAKELKINKHYHYHQNAMQHLLAGYHASS
jgi:3-deoxy-D-manno-octulosonic acid kinase